MSKNKTTAELLERLAKDQRILKQEKERLDLIREKELEQQALERTKKSVNVVEELSIANELLVQQDESLEKQLGTLRTLEKQKKDVLASKDQLEISAQQEVDQLRQDHSDLSREEIIGIERVEKEIRSQALEEITDKTTEELNVAKAQFEEMIRIVKLDNQNYKNLEAKVLLIEEIEKTQRKIDVIEFIAKAMDDGTTLSQIKDNDEDYKSLSDDDRKIIEKYLKQNSKGEFINNSSDLGWEKDIEETNLQQLKQKDEALEIDSTIVKEIELLELAQRIQENFTLGPIEEQNNKLESVQGQLLAEQQKLSLDPNRTKELELEKVELEGNIGILNKISSDLQGLNQTQKTRLEQFFEHQDLEGVDIISALEIEKSQRRNEAFKEIDSLESNVESLEKKLKLIKNSEEIPLPEELEKELLQAKTQINDNTARKQNELLQKMDELDSNDRHGVMGIVKQITSLDKTILEQQQIIDKLQSKRHFTVQSITTLEKEFKELEVASESNIAKPREQEFEERVYFPSKEPWAVKLRDDVAHRKELIEQERSLRKEFQQKLTISQVENESLLRDKIEEVGKELAFLQNQNISLRGELKEKEEMIRDLPVSGVSLAEEFAQIKVEELEIELQKLRETNGSFEKATKDAKEASDKQIAELTERVDAAEKASKEKEDQQDSPRRDSEITELFATVTNKENYLNALEQNNFQLQEKLLTKENDLKSKNNELNSEKLEKDNFLSKIDELSQVAELGLVTKRLAEIEGQQKNAQNELHNIEKDIKDQEKIRNIEQKYQKKYKLETVIQVVETLEKENESNKKTIESLTAENSTLKNDKTNNLELDSLKNQLLKVQQDIDLLNNQNKDLESISKDKEEKISQLNKENDIKTKDLESLQANFENYKSEIEKEVTNNLTELRKQEANAKNDLQNVKKTLEEQKIIRDTEKQYLTEYKVKEILNVVDTLKKADEGKNKTIESLTAELKKAQIQFNEEKKSLTSKNSEQQNTINNQEKEYTLNLKSLQETLTTSQQSESSLKEKNNQISLDLDKLNKDNTSLETQISELEKKFFQKAEDYTRLLEELDAQKTTTEKLLQEKENQIKELKKELDELKADKKYNKEEFDKLKAEKENNKEEYNGLKKSDSKKSSFVSQMI